MQTVRAFGQNSGHLSIFHDTKLVVHSGEIECWILLGKANSACCELQGATSTSQVRTDKCQHILQKSCKIAMEKELSFLYLFYCGKKHYPETTISPKKMPSQKESSLPVTILQVLCETCGGFSNYLGLPSAQG